jgi:hypothetical protein
MWTRSEPNGLSKHRLELNAMRSATFQHGLEAYGQAWKDRNLRAAADLFLEEGTYQVTPFLEPMHVCAAIFNYWSHVAETEREIQFGYEILAVTQEAGIARWWASFLTFRSDSRPSWMGSS